jgi:2,3,4,5-tetrahydropyridine-2-carboxylate N-succinyltransferase
LVAWACSVPEEHYSTPCKRHRVNDGCDLQTLRPQIEALVAGNGTIKGPAGRAVDDVIAALDDGRLRVAEPSDGGWVTHAWIKQAILLYFARCDSKQIGDASGLAFYDKIATKTNYERLGARCVPPGVARYGSFLGRGVILMPGFVNIGAYVDEGTMVDTWATVGSCAQIGKNVHLSGGVGIGGVLEPPQAQPVIIEDGAFIGSRCIVVEGVIVEREAVLGAGVILTASTPIVDVRGAQPVTTKARVPARAIVIPGSIPKEFPAGTYGVPCALIIGTRSESTDRKTSLNAALRDFEVAV